MNDVSLIGRLTKDVDLRETQEGQSVARFVVAVDKLLSKEKKEEYERKNISTADFIPIVVWGGSAKSCATYLQKGSLVGVSGRIQTGSYEKDGEKRYTMDVVASHVQFLEKKNKNGSSDGVEGYELMDGEVPF